MKKSQPATVMMDPERFAAVVEMAARERHSRSEMSRILIEEALRDYKGQPPRDTRRVVTAKRSPGAGPPVIIEGRRVRMLVTLGLDLTERLRAMGRAEDRSIASMMRILIAHGLDARERAARKTA